MPTPAVVALGGMTTLGAIKPFLGVASPMPTLLTFSLSPALADEGVCGRTTFLGAASRLLRWTPTGATSREGSLVSVVLEERLLFRDVDVDVGVEEEVAVGVVEEGVEEATAIFLTFVDLGFEDCFSCVAAFSS